MNKNINKKKQISKLTTEISNIWSGKYERIVTDTSGSYTGNPQDGNEPVQDADDL